MRVCLWPLAEGRGDVSDSLYTGSVGFCQCSLLSRGPSSSLLAYASEQMEEVRRRKWLMPAMTDYNDVLLCHGNVYLLYVFVCWSSLLV